METPPSLPTFEIKVALIGGNVQASDKTTLLNVLLRDKSGEEVSTTMTSDTTGVNEFAVVSSPTSQWELVPEDEPPVSFKRKVVVESIIITSNNNNNNKEEEVTTKRFEVEPEERFFEMRKDTQLVLVNVPSSIHEEGEEEEADANKKYMDYIENNWSTFDCIVVFMDTQDDIKEQVSPLLQLVKDNIDLQQDLPVIVLFNQKVVDDDYDFDEYDDLAEQEHIKQVEELVRKEVEKIFGVTADRSQENFDTILDTYDMLQNNGGDLQVSHFGEEDKPKPSWAKTSPFFIPVTGFVEDSANIDTLLKALSFVLGGEDNQKRIIEERIQLLLSRITYEAGFVQQLEMFHKQLVSLASSDKVVAVDVRPAFWQLCSALEQSYFDDSSSCSCKESKTTTTTEVFARLCQECHEYRRFVMEQEWDTEATRVVAAARSSCCRFFASMKWHFGFCADLKLMYHQLQQVSPHAIDVGTKKALNDTFHRLISDLWRQTLVVVKYSDTLKFLSALVDEIMEYDKLVHEAGLKFVRSYMEETFGYFLRHHLQTLCQKASDGLLYYSYMDPNIPQGSFASLTPMDWNRVFRSILLLRYDAHFCQEFGNEIVWMEYLIDQANSAIVPDMTGQARLKPVAHNQRQMFMKPATTNATANAGLGLLLPSNGFNLSQTVLEIPPSFSDPNHFAHVAWRYCAFLEGRHV
ncbi:unnamed protein product [Cylindrotheca closterium]|uniref:Uncharacterized protein n=1 Tax=Cylindrotheca closterium TaxID=2856 RepID=A0AAD2JHT0_9STRA|nr:unnamed protein product [Cylindrotheca closterium]